MILSSLAKYFQGQKCKIKLIGVFLPGNSHSKEGASYAHFVQGNYLLHIWKFALLPSITYVKQPLGTTKPAVGDTI